MKAEQLVFPPFSEPDTSRKAAERMKTSAGTIRRKVYLLIKAHGPLCSFEIEHIMGLSGNTIRPRIWELRDKMGLIEDSGIRRPTPSGRDAKAWATKGHS